jgi:iron complex outermembrane receptor protein
MHISTFLKCCFFWGAALLFLTFLSPLYGQINGFAYDKTTGETIEKVEVFVGDATQPIPGPFPRGQFLIPTLSQGTKLTIKARGYETVETTVDAGTEQLSISMTPNFTNLEEVQLTAFASGRKLIDQVGGISVISKGELQRDPPLIIAPALNRVPGVYMHSGAFNTNRITIRGIGSRSLFSTNKVRAYLDDIPLTNGSGETTIEDIDLSLVDRVEVIKGPTSSLYGAGLGGSINLSTAGPEYREGSLSTGLLVGSYGLIRNATTFKKSDGKSNITLNYNHTYSDGYRENNQYDRQSINVLGQFYPGAKDRISIVAGLISVKAFIPSSIDSATFVDEPQSAAFTWNKTQGFEDYDKAFVGVSHRHTFNSEWTHSLSFFGSFRNAWEVRPFNILGEQSQSIGVRNRLSYAGNLANRPLRFSLGGELFREWYDWQTYENINGEGGLGGPLSDNVEDRNYYNIFSQAEWQLSPEFRLVVGVNVNQTQYEITDRYIPDSMDISGSYGFEPVVSPRVGIHYRINSKMALHAGASHGFSPPTLEETLTPEGAINPEIQPETGWNFEAGIRGRTLKGKLFYDLSLYSMQIQNLLVARRTGFDQFVGINAGKTQHNGAEIALNYLIFDENDYQIKAFSTYTLALYRFSEFIDGEEDYSGNELTGTPPHTFNAGLDFSTRPGFYGNINYLFVDAMPMRDDNSVYSQAYSVINAKLGFRKTLFQRLELDLSGGINNLTDARYASMILVNAGSFGGRAPRYFYPGLPRNFYGGLTLSWIFSKN